MLAAWILASASLLKQLPDLLANEWYERVTSSILGKIATSMSVPDVGQYQDLYTEWERLRPFQRGADAGSDDYAQYRRRIFNVFLTPYIDQLLQAGQQMYAVRLKDVEQSRLPAYQRQMSWLAYLEPDPHHETRTPYALEDASIGVIWGGSYNLLPIPTLILLLCAIIRPQL